MVRFSRSSIMLLAVWGMDLKRVQPEAGQLVIKPFVAIV